MGAAIVPIAALAVSAIGTGASIYQGRRAEQRAEKASDAQSNEQKRMRDELAEKQRQEEASTAARDARQRQRINTTGLGRKSTVLGSPLGLPDMMTYKGTTALGGGAAA
jgi:hypothetical protein